MTQPYHSLNGYIPQKPQALSPSLSSPLSSSVTKSPTQSTSSRKTLGVRRTYTAAALAALAKSPLAQPHNHALSSRGAVSSASSSSAASADTSWPHSTAAAALASIDISLWSVAHASAKATEQRAPTIETPAQSQDNSIPPSTSSSSITSPTPKSYATIAVQPNLTPSHTNTMPDLYDLAQTKTQKQQQKALGSKTARAAPQERKEVLTVVDTDEDEEATDTDAPEDDNTETDSARDDKITTESEDFEETEHKRSVLSKACTAKNTQKQARHNKKQSENDDGSDDDNEDADATDDDLPSAARRGGRRGGRRGRGRALSMSAAEMTATLRSMQQEGVPLDIMHIRTRLRVSNNIVGLIKRMYLQTGSVDAAQIQQARDSNNKRRQERLKRRKERQEEKQQEETEKTETEDDEKEESNNDSEETSSTTDTHTISSSTTASHSTTPSTATHKTAKTFIKHVDPERKQHSPPVKQRALPDNDTTDSSVASLTRPTRKKKSKRKRSADDDGDDFVTHVIPTEYPNIPGGSHRSLRRRRQVDYTSQLEEDPLTIVELNWYADRAQQPFQVNVDPSVHVMLDIHAHLADTEVIGLLAGHWSSRTQTVSVCAAYPCRSVCTDDDRVNVEMDPASLVSVSELIHSAGLQPMGWYHSHPYFRNHPSMVDVDNQEKYQAMFMQEDHKEQGHHKTPFIASIITPYGSGSFIPLPSDIKWFFNSHSQHVKEQAATMGIPAIPMELWVEVALQQQQPSGNKESQNESHQWTQSYEYIMKRSAALIAEYATIWSRVNFTEKWHPSSNDRDRPQANGDAGNQDSEDHAHNPVHNSGSKHNGSTDQDAKGGEHDDDATIISATPLTPPSESVDTSSNDSSISVSPVLLKSAIRTKRDAFCYSLWQHLSLCTGYTKEKKYSILQTVLQGIDSWSAKGTRGKHTKATSANINKMSEERKE